jgi:hypothetical protein
MFSVRRAVPVLLLTLALWACVPAPDSYPPPFQRTPPSGPEPRPGGAFVNMNDPNAEAHFVRDISPGTEGIGWRWTYARPELRFWLDSSKRQKFVMDFGLPPTTFEHTGPVTLSFFINGKLLAAVRYTRAGDFHFEKAVPTAWLSTQAETLVAVVADKPWVSPKDGVKLSFTLFRAGFIS